MNIYGRPPLGEERLSYTLSIPVTEALRQRLVDEARQNGFRSLADFVRCEKLEPAHRNHCRELTTK